MENKMMTGDLQAQIHALNKRNAELENTVAELSALVNHFKELFRLSQIKRFAASSEKLADGQLAFLIRQNLPHL